ncbi:possible Photosystem II reaction center M protein (PsbM) [Prochlorococcus marinus str. MIT 9313]|uniref:Photosystem II reaction center protein M n=2 Tax=Prochlorococcus marinus TaxID=1219 RepID=PSBM_PROMM|nr:MULTISPECIES: photosystem II reaction center protein PsbM [Prochlorococcus]A2CBT5.1 RecName: Full=Photosystem II reaction center protein M; Short=PSII-M [Prochlorococcus marinus str. MIT 9303]Q7TUP7.1 RecName: Full=Photosystem II reaction center protein M; Short=PSII-M [Prochlorococcus marinus str. MIT 9313]MCH2566046.1 photosystem II reaction center protein M [Prochlorococcus sp. ALOHA_A2.0_51]MEC7382488.1 photosystem II reaction center protein PsbM [Cyanobacteriota bacterium]RPG00529.1 MA
MPVNNFGFLATLLFVAVPMLFLIGLYIQTNSNKS